jgi:hypothetical protein
MQLKNELDQAMPGVEVHAEHFPPGPFKTALSYAVTGCQMLLMVGAFGGQQAIEAVSGTPAADVLVAVQENKMSYMGGAWFMGNIVSTSILKTGAFEVQLRSQDGSPHDAVTVWSGIERGGRTPNTMQEIQDILNALRSTMREAQSSPALDAKAEDEPAL